MSGSELLALTMFLSFITLVLSGFPVAWLLGGLAVLFTALAIVLDVDFNICLLYTSPSPRDKRQSRMPSSA